MCVDTSLQNEVQQLTLLILFCIFMRILSVVEILLAAVINKEAHKSNWFYLL